MLTGAATFAGLPVLPVLILASVAPPRSHTPAAPGLDVDHIILAINHLDRGIEEFTRLTGVVPERGGQHPGRGTENALVSLGAGHYLEILAPMTPPSDSRSRADGFTRLTPAGWALHTSSLAAIIARLRTAAITVSGPIPGSRRRPDGTLLQWQTASVTGNGLELAPFFIEWRADSAHPSTTSPRGCRLEGLELLEPQPAHLEQFFAAIAYQATIRTQHQRGMRLTLDCPKGRVSFAS